MNTGLTKIEMGLAPMKLAKQNNRRLVIFAALSVLIVLMLGCSTGTYPIDIFPEMHYQQSYKIQEPPSLSAPPGSVPISGGEVLFAFADAESVTSPFPSSQATIQRGEELFRVNCAVCHGAGGQGDGPMQAKLDEAGYSGTVANLTTGATPNRPDGEVFFIISEGWVATLMDMGMSEDAASQFLMPPFRKLISEDDRWMIVHYLRSIEQ